VTARSPAESLPYEDSSFDTVVASLVLCSVDDQDRALAETAALLVLSKKVAAVFHKDADE